MATLGKDELDAPAFDRRPLEPSSMLDFDGQLRERVRSQLRDESRSQLRGRRSTFHAEYRWPASRTSVARSFENESRSSFEVGEIDFQAVCPRIEIDEIAAG